MSEIEELRRELAAYKRDMTRVAIACLRGRLDDVSSIHKVRAAMREYLNLEPLPNKENAPRT